MWGRVEWTDKGKAHVAAREYRYVSPVYYYQQDTGDIQAIESVALTNVPNLTGLKALAAREPGLNLFTGDITMSFLKTMASVLGITDVEPTEAAVETAARRVMADVGAMKCAMSVMAEAAKTDDKTPGGIAKAVQAIARACRASRRFQIRSRGDVQHRERRTFPDEGRAVAGACGTGQGRRQNQSGA